MSFISQTRNTICFHRSLLLSTVQKRYNTREAIHRYVEPDKFKKHMLAAAEPYLKRKYELPSETCKGTTPKTHELHPLQKIYSDELQAAIEQNDFLLFIQHNYTPFQSERVYKNTLIKSGGQFFSHRNEVYQEVFGQLGMKQMGHLLVARNSLVLGPMDKLADCVIALKKMPQFLLLAGCIHKEVYTLEQLQLISVETNLDLCRANLLSILERPGVDLGYMLEEYVKMNEGTSADNTKDSPEQPSAPTSVDKDPSEQ